MKLDKEIIKNKPRKVVSSKEALNEVIPFFSDNELKSIKENNEFIRIK